VWCVVVVVAVAVGGLGACKQDERLLPPGEYGGSTALDQRLHLSLSDEPKVNGLEAEWDGRGRIKLVEVPGEPVMSCVVQAKGEELRCQVPRPGNVGGFETVELMRE